MEQTGRPPAVGSRRHNRRTISVGLVLGAAGLSFADGQALATGEGTAVQLTVRDVSFGMSPAAVEQTLQGQGFRRWQGNTDISVQLKVGSDLNRKDIRKAPKDFTFYVRSNGAADEELTIVRKPAATDQPIRSIVDQIVYMSGYRSEINKLFAALSSRFGKPECAVETSPPANAQCIWKGSWQGRPQRLSWVGRVNPGTLALRLN